jgi:hypothetical protein
MRQNNSTLKWFLELFQAVEDLEVDSLEDWDSSPAVSLGFEGKRKTETR